MFNKESLFKLLTICSIVTLSEIFIDLYAYLTAGFVLSDHLVLRRYQLVINKKCLVTLKDVIRTKNG